MLVVNIVKDLDLGMDLQYYEDPYKIDLVLSETFSVSPIGLSTSSGLHHITA